MSAVQPDLFGDYDREEAEKIRAAKEADRRHRAWQAPQTCPSCGTEEPSGYLLRNNHGYDPEHFRICGYPQGEHPNYGNKCIAQDLVTNHITYDARKGHTDALERSMTRGRELGLDVEAIRDAALEA